MISTLLFGILLSSVSVTSLTVTWNGTTITGPVLIFQDELVRDDRTNVLATPVDGTVICRSENQAQVGWHFADGALVQINNHFRHRRTGSSATPSVSRLTTNRPDEALTSAAANGLWTCRLNVGIITVVPVGIYARGGGRGAISGIQITLTSFQSNPPTFTLLAATIGGPPTTYTWTRNGQVITNSASYSISIQVERSPAGFQNSRYRSTLTVTGRLPGVYQYSVTNRATSGKVTRTFTIESGAPPTDVTAEQFGLSRVLVMWAAPSPPPTDGYQVQITRGSTTTTVSVAGTSYSFSVNNQYGLYSIQVRSPPSQHFQSNEAAMPVETTVRGILPPVISTPSPTETSATITWTQPEFSLPVVGYTVTATRLNGLACASYTESRLPVTTTSTVMSVQFTDLQEFSSYRTTVTAVFSATFEVTPASSNLEFTTLSAAPTGAPSNVTYTPYTAASTHININWSQIDCTERNGVITDYTVVLQEHGGAVIPGRVNVMDRTFTASGLTPHTNYIFRVAGVNSNGTGPYSDDITVLTDEDVPGVVFDPTGQPKFTTIVLTWSVPQEPNGVIISYEVTYRVSDGNLVITNTTDLRFTIPSLTPGTNVTEISVSAYTSVGRGDSVQILHLMTLASPPKVIVMVRAVSTTSIQVTWDRLCTSEITGYRIYYRQTGKCEMDSTEQYSTVSCSENSVMIDNLLTNVEYQFQVVAIAGDTVAGERSNVSVSRTISPIATTETLLGEYGTIIITAVVTFILTLILYTLVLLLVVCCVNSCRGTNSTASSVERVDTYNRQVVYDEVGETRSATEKAATHNTQAVYEEVGEARKTKEMELKENEAYGSVTVSSFF